MGSGARILLIALVGIVGLATAAAANAVSVLLPPNKISIQTTEATATRNGWVRLELSCESVAGQEEPCSGVLGLMPLHHPPETPRKAMKYASRQYVIPTESRRLVALHLRRGFFSGAGSSRLVRAVAVSSDDTISSTEVTIYKSAPSSG